MRATKPKIECLFVALIVLMLAVGMTLVADSKSMKVSEAPLGSTGATDSGAQPLVISAFSTLEEMTAYDAVLAKPEPQVIPFQQRPALQGVGPAGAAPRAPIEAAPPMPGQGPSPDAPPLVTNFIGVLDDLTYIPPDTMGAVGPNHIVEFLNSGFTVFNRAGAVVSPQITLQAFWAALGTLAGQPASRPFDPKVIYDQHSSRWIVVSDGNPNGRDGTNNSWVLVGISQSSDPTLGWNLYAIDPDADNNEWADYPGFGVDSANMYVTNNMFTVAANPAFTQARFWVISKAAMIAGNIVGQFSTFADASGGFVWQPCHSFDVAPNGNNYIVTEGWFDAATTLRRFLRVQQFTGVGAAAALTDLGYLEVNNYNLWILDAPQLNCTQDIATNDTRLLNAVLRNGKIWTTHEVGTGTGWIYPPPSSSGTEVAWYEFSPAAVEPWPTSPAAVPIQQGRVTGMLLDPPLYYYYPSIAVNKNECVALGFSGSSEEIYASAYYTMRQPADPPGTMQPVGLLKAGEAPYWKQFSGTRNRWGDFSATVVDPVDDATFWTVQEYASNGTVPVPCTQDSGVWGTWWGSFECVTCDKWVQPPDETYNGIDIRCDRADGIQRILADDFNCIRTGPINKVVLWGSWRSDDKGRIQKIHLSIHSDDPCGPGGSDPDNDYSKPDQLLWSGDFTFADFVETLYSNLEPEWFWDPTTGMPPISYEHYGIWQYDISIDSNAFVQQGDPCNPIVYWLDVWVELDPDIPGTEFGWKTSSEHWQDDAVFWDETLMDWQELRYPEGHQLYPNSIDLAFKIITEVNEPEKPLQPHTKWSQPPIEIDPTAEVPTYCGWDEASFLASSSGTSVQVYENFDSGGIYQYYSPGTDLMADDIDLAGTNRELDHYNFTVYAPAGTAPYTVTSELYTDNAGYPGTPIPGTSCTHTVSSDYLVVLDCAPSPGITLPNNVWMVLSFSDEDAGWTMGEGAEIGYTDDLFAKYSGGSWALYWFGGSPYAGFEANIWCKTAGSFESKLVADDFRCIGSMPVTSIHWWGSYVGWESSGTLPPVLPANWWIGFWSNVPAGAPPDYLTYSHPSRLLHSITIPAARVDFNEIGSDEYYGYYPYDICYQYNVELEPNEVFWQNDFNEATYDNVYWISIVAEYNDVDPQHFWGWKSRPWHWMDDAVTFNLPSKPGPNYVIPDPGIITPITDPVWQESFDMAFELDTDPNYIKWEQLYTGIRHWPHYEDVNSTYNAEDPCSYRLVFDDWQCLRRTPVTSIVWWGSYIGYGYEACSYGPFMPLPVKPDYFVLAIWSDVPAGADPYYPFSHPDEPIWVYDAYDYDEVLVGYDKHPHGEPNEPVFRYSVRLPEEDWFKQRDVNSIFWLNVLAVYDTTTPNYSWGWTNHKHVFNDDAVSGRYVDDQLVWTELYDQTGASEDMSFMLFTDPDECNSCADYNLDLIVNFEDYADFADAWLWTGTPGGNNSDLNCDGSVDYYDLKIFVDQWLNSCP